MSDEGLLDQVPCGLLSFKDDGTIIAANKNLLAWLGYSKEELIGKNIETILTLASRIFYNTHFFPIIKLHAKAEEIFLTLLAKDKKDVPVLTNAQRVTDADEVVNHCVFITVHQRRKYEEEILNAKREAENAVKENKDLQVLTESLEAQTLELDRQFQKQLALNNNLLQFSKIISHDLQEPLRKIRIFLDVISKEEKDRMSERTRNTIHKMDAASKRLKNLINGLHEYVDIDSEKQHSQVDLNVAVQVGKTKAIEKRKFADFDLICRDLPIIGGYRAQLELLFFQLIDNAIQFRNPERKLKIEISGVLIEENVYKVSREKYKFTEHVRMYFMDNGTGFDNRYKEYAFELLKKIDPSTEGLGIGLPLVKKIVDNHSGAIELQSDKNKGTRFIIVLPKQQS